MSTATERREPDGRDMPRTLRWAGAVAVAMLAAGAVLLLTVRGEAMLIDLYATAQQMLCF
jgi:hypothetical protein